MVRSTAAVASDRLPPSGRLKEMVEAADSP